MVYTVKNGKFLVITTSEGWENLTLESLFKNYWKAPKKLVHEWRMEKAVLVNDTAPSWTVPFEEKSTISIPVFKEEPIEISISNEEIEVLFEDDHLLVVNKPAGMDTHPSHPSDNNTLLNAVAGYIAAKECHYGLKHIHRLDKDTTGAVLFAKHPFAGSLLDRMLEERKIKRTYLALVEGVLTQDNGTINEKIGRDRHHGTRRRVSPSGQQAITHFKVLKRMKDKNLTLIKCSLETGRTHQIRVHLHHIGHPLAGDVLYSGKPVFPRQALHAAALQLHHPITGEIIKCLAPPLDSPPIFHEDDIKFLNY
ncbi:RluA family pseudouridine synthase [Peribacillus saganii]|uniref:Pseudouridine synthase n=1 Tax=Peribacillus saganii TaxID=2303992 RepID=A0A372LV38_9BACI|nr:RluA family pseudouridine synthase [Peribacillus saganii]RFU71434.1 RluA family pseudouridine synthase [Peribacillus saganii]